MEKVMDSYNCPGNIFIYGVMIEDSYSVIK